VWFTIWHHKECPAYLSALRQILKVKVIFRCPPYSLQTSNSLGHKGQISSSIIVSNFQNNFVVEGIRDTDITAIWNWGKGRRVASDANLG